MRGNIAFPYGSSIRIPSTPTYWNAAIIETGWNLGGDGGDVLKITPPGYSGSTIKFYTSPGGGDVPAAIATEKMRLDHNGNVGIGTTSPGATLDVSGVVALSGGLTGAAPTPRINFGDYYDNSGDASVSHIDLWGGVYGFGISGGTLNIITDQNTHFLEDVAGTMTSRMMIAAGGNVGIGTASPQTSLEVAGTISSTGVSVTGVISASSNVYASAYLHLSDKRLKTDIEPISNSLSILERLEGIRFVWKKSGIAAYGLIAQDTQRVVPEAVPPSSENLAVDYDQMIPILIESVKELSRRNRRLEHEIEGLRKERQP